MSLLTVQLRITCLVEDPHAPARVMGVLAARSLVPLTFLAERSARETVDIDVLMEMEQGEGPGPQHLARLLARLSAVSHVLLLINGRPAPIGFESTPA